MTPLGHRCYKRRVNANGTVQVGKQRYYIRQKLHGQYVILGVDAIRQEFVVTLHRQLIKQTPSKGLLNEKLPFQEFLELMCKEAQAEWRLQ